jgi:hypothetical protein
VFCDDVHNEGTLALNNLRFDCRAAACQVCLDLNFNHFPGYASSMEIFWMNLVSSAKEGCESCSILEEGLRLWSLEISSPKKSYLDILPTGRIKIYHIRDAPLSLHFLPDVVEEGDLYLQFYTVSGGQPDFHLWF